MVKMADKNIKGELKMRFKRIITAAVTAAVAVSGSISASAAGSVTGYENVDNYIADCLLNGYISLETGGREDADQGFYNLEDPGLYNYEQLAEDIMFDMNINDPQAGLQFENNTAEQNMYEILIADYLTNEKNKITASKNNTELFANKKTKYKDKILSELVKANVASTKNEALSMIKSGNANDNKKTAAAIKKLNLEKNLSSYTTAVSSILKVNSKAYDYYELLTSALAVAELDSDKTELLNAAKAASSGNIPFCKAIDNIVKTIESTYGKNEVLKGDNVIANYSINAVWDAVKKDTGITVTDADAALDQFFSISEESAAKKRILLQYVFNGYMKDAVISIRSKYDLSKNADAAEDFQSAYENYVVYQDYSSEYSAEYAAAFNSDSASKVSNETATFVTENNLISSWYLNYLKYTSDKNNSADVPEGAVEYNGHYYMVFDNSISWRYAKEYCELMNGHLATVADEAEQEVVVNVAVACKTAENFWIGGFLDKKSGEWKWVDGTKFDYAPWDDKQPDFHENNEYYIRFTNRDIQYENWLASKGMWNDCANEASGNNSKGDAVSIQTFAFICEWDSKEDFQSYIPGDANGDGKVNVRDAAYIASKIAKKKEKDLSLAADFNGDGKINIRDAAAIAKYLVSHK